VPAAIRFEPQLKIGVSYEWAALYKQQRPCLKDIYIRQRRSSQRRDSDFPFVSICCLVSASRFPPKLPHGPTEIRRYGDHRSTRMVAPRGGIEKTSDWQDVPTQDARRKVHVFDASKRSSAGTRERGRAGESMRGVKTESTSSGQSYHRSAVQRWTPTACSK